MKYFMLIYLLIMFVPLFAIFIAWLVLSRKFLRLGVVDKDKQRSRRIANLVSGLANITSIIAFIFLNKYVNSVGLGVEQIGLVIFLPAYLMIAIIYLCSLVVNIATAIALGKKEEELDRSFNEKWTSYFFTVVIITIPLYWTVFALVIAVFFNKV